MVPRLLSRFSRSDCTRRGPALQARYGAPIQLTHHCRHGPDTKQPFQCANRATGRRGCVPCGRTVLNMSGVFAATGQRTTMRFTLPFLLGIAAFTATVFGVNVDELQRERDELSFDVLSASTGAIAFRLAKRRSPCHHGRGPRSVGAAILLTIPALFAFHHFPAAVRRLGAAVCAQKGRDRGTTDARQPRIQLLLDEDARLSGYGERRLRDRHRDWSPRCARDTGISSAGSGQASPSS